MKAKKLFLENYRQWMWENGLEQRKLASLTEQSPNVIGYVSTGRIPPSLAYLSKLKILFRDFDYSELFEERPRKRKHSRQNGGTRTLASLPSINAIKLLPDKQVCKIIVFYANDTFEEIAL
ncbi:hypothetical protein [Persicitalea sp.]|uniref:hypothetical protein n=1 Tax=Persicitalea sp. TaxID=3100273 RepID=UPI0035936993